MRRFAGAAAAVAVTAGAAVFRGGAVLTKGRASPPGASSAGVDTLALRSFVGSASVGSVLLSSAATPALPERTIMSVLGVMGGKLRLGFTV